MELLLAALAGLLIGSFLNVCIYRLPRDLSVSRPPRSFCPQCEKMIAWYDNIPLLSYVLLKGKCRHCAAAIPWRYPLVEALTAGAFVLAVGQHGVGWFAAKQSILHAILIVLFFSDLEEMILPDEFTLGGAVAGLILAWFVPSQIGLADVSPIPFNEHLRSVINASAAGGFFALTFWITAEVYYRVRDREGLGLGDVKMMLTLGAFMGLYQTALVILLASVVGAVVGGALIYWQRGSLSTTEIPFGSFLAAAAVIVSISNPGLAPVYLSVFRCLECRIWG